MKKNIIILVVLLVFVGGGAGAFFVLKVDDSKPVAGAEVEGSGVPVEPEGDPIYLPLDPAFVVNFEHNGSIRYLQLSLQIMSYEQTAVDKAAANMPAVRNALILLFSGQDYDSLNTVEGKENLRKLVLDSINRVVHLTDGSLVNEVFFTGFVMQ